jgi:hypothetical protein
MSLMYDLVFVFYSLTRVFPCLLDDLSWFSYFALFSFVCITLYRVDV